MKHVVVTGGTRGIGAGLVEQFVRRGCRVTYSGTTDRSVTGSYEKFPADLDPSLFKGVVCDVARPAEIMTLRDFAVKMFGPVDIWVNNAGIANDQKPVTTIPDSEIRKVIETNISGLIAATSIAYDTMAKQDGGLICNMGGLGTDGRMIEGLIPYGLTKRAVGYFTKGLAKEVRNTNIRVVLLLPGMVITDMILDPIRKNPEQSRRSRRIFNLLGEEVHTVTEFLVERILEDPKNGSTISFLNSYRMLSNIIKRPFQGRDIISDKL